MSVRVCQLGWCFPWCSLLNKPYHSGSNSNNTHQQQQQQQWQQQWQQEPAAVAHFFLCLPPSFPALQSLPCPLSLPETKGKGSFSPKKSFQSMVSTFSSMLSMRSWQVKDIYSMTINVGGFPSNCWSPVLSLSLSLSLLVTVFLLCTRRVAGRRPQLKTEVALRSGSKNLSQDKISLPNFQLKIASNGAGPQWCTKSSC